MPQASSIRLLVAVFWFLLGAGVAGPTPVMAPTIPPSWGEFLIADRKAREPLPEVSEDAEKAEHREKTSSCSDLYFRLMKIRWVCSSPSR